MRGEAESGAPAEMGSCTAETRCGGRKRQFQYGLRPSAQTKADLKDVFRCPLHRNRPNEHPDLKGRQWGKGNTSTSFSKSSALGTLYPFVLSSSLSQLHPPSFALCGEHASSQDKGWLFCVHRCLRLWQDFIFPFVWCLYGLESFRQMGENTN